MRAIVDTMDELGIAVGPNNRKYISMVDNEVPINTGVPFPAQYLEALRALWADKGVQTVYARAHEYALCVFSLYHLAFDRRCKPSRARTAEYHLMYRQENLPYFYANIDRVFQPGYQPSQDDILRVRSKTTGISETRFDMRDMIVRLFDVGGQRSERRKWASCFENVTSILFLVSLSDYNACIIEDKGELPDAPKSHRVDRGLVS